MNQSTIVLTVLCVVLASTTALLWLRLRAKRRAAATSTAWHATVEQSPHGALLVNARTLRIIATNAALRGESGFSEVELSQLTLQQLFVDDESPDSWIRRLRAPDPQAPMHVHQCSKNGLQTDVEITGYPVETGRERMLGYSTRDITLRSKFETRLLEKQQHLDHLAHHDQLTGLPNRLFLAANLPAALEDAQRIGEMLAVLFLDLDRFKHINDSSGHETGDLLLKTVAQRIRNTMRSEDLVVRMGGDEFIVVLKGVRHTEQVNEAASRITESLSSPIVINGRPLITTASIGVSVYPRDGADMGELLRHSDTAMYQAKERGRNNCQVFSPFMDQRLKQRIAIETNLRLALQAQQLDVYYQPIVDIVSQKVVALESLLRWKHPSHGFIAPARFIGIAEDSGLIVPIGEFVLERVLQDAQRWRQAGYTLVPIALNVSAAQLQRSDLAAAIVKLTNLHGLEPSLLQIELTESTIFERREGRNGEPNEDAVAHLRDLGVRISIDDFGTGYSSLSYLKRWTIDYLKIDRSFIRDLVTDPSDLAIVGAIIAMARHLHIPVIAEGIEGWQQLEKLRDMGCALAQGHLFAKPTPPHRCHRFLSGAPIDLINRERRADPLETTASWARPA